MHSDLGGFANPVLDNELYTRWLQYGVFQPIFRPHAQDEVPPEPVYREAHTKELARESIRLRYRLLPYNYTLAFENNQRGLPLMRPMLYEEPRNAKVAAMSSTYLWGKDFLVTPVLSKGATTQEVYFPAHSVWFDFYSDAPHAGGVTASVQLAEDHIPVYVRAGAFIPMAKPMHNTGEYSAKSLELHYYHDASVKAGSGQLYDDDGETAQAYEKGQYQLLHFASRAQGRTLNLDVKTETGAHATAAARSIELVVHNVAAQPSAVKVDGSAVASSWDAAKRLLTVQLPASAAVERKVSIALSSR
jgi:alpha-glucosidase/oligosaccharide 4-alpha-D-glucosyltransferase